VTACPAARRDNTADLAQTVGVPPRKPSPVGAHVPVGSGLARGALPYAARVGAEALQVFLSNPRGWAAGAGDPQQDLEFRETCAARRWPVFVHAPYLVNLGSPVPATLERSVTALRHVLRRAAAIGAAGVVVHAGSAVDGTLRELAVKQVRENLLPVLDGLSDDDPRVLIEPTAGGGSALAATVGELGGLFTDLDAHPRLGVCLDTCHAFAAGHDLAAPGGVRATLNALLKAVGRGRLALVHANDSRDPVGSGRDRHAGIGAGTIGAAAFGELFVHPVTRGVPILVETPGREEGHAADVRTLKRLREQAR
jgi:deoxyribonuclease-4